MPQNEWCSGTWVEMCCLNTWQCPLPRWKVATSGCPPLGKLWELSTECLGQTSRLRSCWVRARWPQSWSQSCCCHGPWGAVAISPRVDTHPCGKGQLWLVKRLPEQKKGQEVPSEVTREKHIVQSRKTVLIDPLALYSCPVTLNLFPWLP